MSNKKFEKPYETYEIGRIKPMAIELDPTGLAKYREQAKNPLYYFNAIQYAGGELYRAALGYEVLWDAKKEEEIMLCLDFFITDLDEKGDYYLEEVRALKDFRIHGINWIRGIAPKTLNFNLQWPYEIKYNESLTARINLLDRPHHVDLERANGDVFTIPFTRYQNCLSTGLIKQKKGPHERSKFQRNGQATKRIPNSTAKGLGVVRRLIKERQRSSPVFKAMHRLRTGS